MRRDQDYTKAIDCNNDNQKPWMIKDDRDRVAANKSGLTINIYKRLTDIDTDSTTI